MVLFIFMGSASAANTTKKVSISDKNFTTVKIPFTQNNGQITDKNVKYSANTFIGTVYVENNGIVYKLSKDKKTWIVSEQFKNANNVSVAGLDKSKTKVNYYIGKNSKNWKTNLSTYQQVLYTNLYAGVNLHLQAHGKNIEKIYVISRNGSPNSIWVNVNGSTGLKINKNGQLEILNGSSALKLTKPVAYQIINGKKVKVSISYLIKGNSYGYKTGAYNKNYKLIIDPLLASTYLGGNSYDGANAITVDKAGNVYVAGYTGSTYFPGADQSTYNAGKNYNEWDVFVSKFSSDLSTLQESTYIGGSYSDQAKGIALDSNGNVFITGITYSTGNYTNNDFPVGIHPGLNMTWDTGAGDVFVTKLTSNLGLIRSAIIGGNRADVANAILVDASNNVYITGQTFSFNGTDPKNVPVTSYPIAYSSFGEPTMATNYSGIGDVFVTKLNNDLTDMPAGAVFGGVDGSTSYANAIGIDQQNYIYITGATNSSTFPIIQLANKYPDNGLLNNNGGYDAFVVKLSSQALENIESVALLGGSQWDMGNGIAVDPVGRVYVVGGTWSQDFQPIVSQQSSHNNGPKNTEDGFVTILDKQLQSVLYSIYLGGSSNDVANDVVVPGLGPDFGVIGTTNSTNFSGVTSSQKYYGNEDVFFSIIKNPNTTQQTQDTSIIGGANADYGASAAITPNGSVYLTGNTWSNDYPTTIGAYDNIAHDNNGYSEDAYITKIDNFLDTKAPVITKTDPKSNEANVAINKVINVVYSEPIQKGSNFNNIVLLLNGNSVPINTGVTGNTLVIVPKTSYVKGGTYTLKLPSDAIEDLAGNSADAYMTSFTTVPLTVTSSDPANSAVNVGVNKVIKVVYPDNIKAGSQFNQITLNTSNGPVAISTSTSGNTLLITPTTKLNPGTSYTLNIPNDAIESLIGDIATAYTTNFSTVPPLTVTSTDPTNNAVNVGLNKAIQIVYSAPIQAGANFNGITLSTINGSVGLKSITTSANSLIIVPLTNLIAGTTYTLNLPNDAIEDLTGSPSASYTTSFTTLPPLQVAGTDPANYAVSVPVNKVIKVTFNRQIQSGLNYSQITLKNSANTVIPITTSIIGNVLTIIKSSGTFAGDTYTLTLPVNSVVDVNNTSMLSAYSTQFTVDSTPPKITSITPAKNAIKVATNKAIVVNFSKPIKIGPGAISIKSSSGKVIAITSYKITNGGKTLTLYHSKLFAKGTKYTIYFANGSITDMANNYLAAYSSSFTTTK